MYANIGHLRGLGVTGEKRTRPFDLAFQITSEYPDSMFYINPSGNVKIKSATVIGDEHVNFTVPFEDMMPTLPGTTVSGVMLIASPRTKLSLHKARMDMGPGKTKVQGRIGVAKNGVEVGSLRYYVLKRNGTPATGNTPNLFAPKTTSPEVLKSRLDYAVKKGWIKEEIAKTFQGYLDPQTISASAVKTAVGTFTGTSTIPFASQALPIGYSRAVEYAFIGRKTSTGATNIFDRSRTTFNTNTILNSYIAPVAGMLPKEIMADIDNFYDTANSEKWVMDMVEAGIPASDAQQMAIDQVSMAAQFKKDKMMYEYGIWMKGRKPASFIPAVVTENADKALAIMNRTLDPSSYVIAFDYLELLDLYNKVGDLSELITRAYDKISEHEFKTFNFAFLTYLSEGGTPMGMYFKAADAYNKRQEKKAGAFNLFKILGPVLSIIPGPSMAFGLAITAANQYSDYRKIKSYTDRQEAATKEIEREVKDINAVIDQAVAKEIEIKQENTDQKVKKTGLLVAGGTIVAGIAAYLMMD